MKQIMRALFMVSTMNGMDLLRKRLEDEVKIYLYDLPADNQQWDVNEVVQGKTMLDLLYLTDKVDLDFVEYLRNKGAKAAYELRSLTPNQWPLDRANRMFGHVVPAQILIIAV